MVNLNDMRQDYSEDDPLQQAAFCSDPFQQFEKWFADATTQAVAEANACVLSTADRTGKVLSRVMLLKFFDSDGFVFFTNYLSQKGQQLADNPQASLLFWWQPMHRQVRVVGRVRQLDAEHSDAYFASRARASQLGALASQQSEPIASRAALLARFDALEAAYADKPVPRPAHWGGYVLIPDEIEFWQGGANRLHDRLRYRRTSDGAWEITRLAP